MIVGVYRKAVRSTKVNDSTQCDKPSDINMEGDKYAAN